MKLPNTRTDLFKPLAMASRALIFCTLLVWAALPLSLLAAPAAQDVTPPSLVGSTPTDGATEIPVNTTITFQFDEPVLVFEGDIALSCPQGTAIPFSVGGDGTDTITLTPSADLPAATTCAWDVISVADAEFNQIAQQVSGSFTTAGGAAPTPTATPGNPGGAFALTSVTPADGATNVAINSAITFTFNRAAVVFEGGITLACPQGSPVQFALAGDNTDTITITPSAALPANTTCAWSLLDITDASFEQLPVTNGSFTTTGGAAPTATATTVAPTATATTVAPTATATTSPGGITITSVTPANNATDVPIDTQIVINFSQGVFVFPESFTLACPAGTPIQLTLGGAENLTTSVTLTPAANLPAGVTCTWQAVGAEIYDAAFTATNLQASGTFSTKAGGTNPNPDPGNSSIVRIEVNQALGVQFKNELNFVAGKPTVIRAFLQEATSINAQQTSVVVKRDGQTVTTLQPKSTNRPENVVDFLCSNLDACGRWAAGKYVFEVTVNGATRSTEGTIYEFKERAGMRILAVPVTVKFNGVLKSVPDERWKETHQLVKKVYPIAPGKVEWIIGQELRLENVDVLKGQRKAVWDALAGLQPKGCVPPAKAQVGDTPCYDKIVGFIGDYVLTASGECCVTGFTWGHPANIVVAGARRATQDIMGTVAHEIGHNYQLGDTYNGGAHNCRLNPPPDAFRGRDYYTRKPLPNGCQAGKEASRTGRGTKVPAAHNPYDVTERGPLPDMTSFMAGSGGDGTDKWTTQEAYSVIFKALAPSGTPNFVSTFGLSVQNAPAPSRYIDIFGFLSVDNQIELAPWYVFEDDAPFRSTTGAFMVTANNASGDVLASYAFDEPVFEGETHAEDAATENAYVALDEQPFSALMLMPDGTTEFRIVKDGRVLKTLPVSTNAPTVQVTAPTANQTLNGEFTIEWTANDADGDALTYFVEYNPDVTNPESDWYVLAADITETSLVEYFDFLPGGNNAQIIVTASDGVLSSEGISAQFKVPVQKPDVYIFEPEGGYSYAVGDDVELEADAYDVQLAEFIPDAQIVWTSDIDGQLGTGAIMVAKGLSEGTHTITVEATDSNGATVSDQIKLYVGNVSGQYIARSTTGNTTVENTYAGSTVSLTIPAALVTNDTYADLYSYQTPFSETPPQGFQFADRFFAIFVDELVNDEWQPITTTDAGAILTVSYGDLPTGVQPDTLRIHRFDDETGEWIDVATECTPNSSYDRSVAGQLSVAICHFSEYALTGTTDSTAPSNALIYLPLIEQE